MDAGSLLRAMGVLLLDDAQQLLERQTGRARRFADLAWVLIVAIVALLVAKPRARS